MQSILCLADDFQIMKVTSHKIDLNEAHFKQAPAWLTSQRAQKVIDSIQTKLEWDIRKIQVYWYTDQVTFGKAHGFGDSVLAFSKKQDGTVHIGPRINTSNFDGVFGHELVHIILFQKYKNAIPAWLEEGMANYLAHQGTIDYPWLASQPARDVHTMVHPFKALTADGSAPNPRYVYMASTALMEMIASHCSVSDLIQLSVGKSLETYLTTFCGIDDVNAEFRKWLLLKTKK